MREIQQIKPRVGLHFDGEALVKLMEVDVL